MIKTSSSSSSSLGRWGIHSTCGASQAVSYRFRRPRRGGTRWNAFHSLSARSEKTCRAIEKIFFFLLPPSPPHAMFSIFASLMTFQRKLKISHHWAWRLLKLERREFINFWLAAESSKGRKVFGGKFYASADSRGFALCSWDARRRERFGGYVMCQDDEDVCRMVWVSRAFVNASISFCRAFTNQKDFESFVITWWKLSEKFQERKLFWNYLLIWSALCCHKPGFQFKHKNSTLLLKLKALLPPLSLFKLWNLLVYFVTQTTIESRR